MDCLARSGKSFYMNISLKNLKLLAFSYEWKCQVKLSLFLPSDSHTVVLQIFNNYMYNSECCENKMV